MMSLQRFSLYFAALMACAVVAFPRWAPAAHSASSEPVSLPAYQWAASRPAPPRPSSHLRRRGFVSARLVASR